MKTTSVSAARIKAGHRSAAGLCRKLPCSPPVLCAFELGRQMLPEKLFVKWCRLVHVDERVGRELFRVAAIQHHEAKVRELKGELASGQRLASGAGG